jgi:hypothetical protein
VVDRNRFVNEVPSTLKFTGVDADTATHEWEGVCLSDNTNCLEIVPFRYLTDISGYVNAGRAGSLAGRRAFIRGVLGLNASRVRGKGNDVLRTDALAGAATGAEVWVNHR